MSENKKTNLLQKVKNLVEEGYGRVVIARQLGISDSMATRLIKDIKVGIEPKEEEQELSSIIKVEKSNKFTNPTSPKTGSILVIGDAHSNPLHSNERFTKLGKLISELQPDVIVQIGDFHDMASLSSYDVGKKSFEGRRYKLDLETAWDSMERIEKHISKGSYRPQKYVTLGNHENRINKVVNNDPKLDGTLSTDNLRFDDYGWEVIPFLKPLNLMGLTFQHYYTSGSMDRAISSENTGRTILKKYHSSCFAGHNHKLDLAYEANAKGKLMIAGTVGCYFDHLEEWQSINAQSHFWRGVLLLEDVEDGSIGDLHQLTLAKINKLY